MEEIKYFVPKNREELEKLVGKPINVIFTEGISPILTFPNVLIFYGVNDGYYEFIKQLILKKIDININRTQSEIYKIDNYIFSVNSAIFGKFGMKVNGEVYREIYGFHESPRGVKEAYIKRLNFLKENKLWRE